MRIRRQRPAPPRPMDALTGPAPPLVTYAMCVSSNGEVTGWAANVGWAEEFDAATVARVLAADRTGQLSIEGENPVPTPAEKPEQPRAAKKGRRHRVAEEG